MSAKKHNPVLANFGYLGIVQDYKICHLIIDLGEEYVERYIVAREYKDGKYSNITAVSSIKPI